MTAANTQPTAFQTGHVGLNVSDLERSKRFYQEVFGFEVTFESQENRRAFAFLSQDERLVLTLWQQSAGAFDVATPGLHHLSFQVADIAQVRQAETRVRALGARLYHDGIVPHGEGKTSGGIFFADPDGIRLEIYAPTGADDNAAPTSHAPTCGFF